MSEMKLKCFKLPAETLFISHVMSEIK